MRTCVQGARIYCRGASRLLRWSGLRVGLTGFVANRVWVPELRGRGMLWVVLWGVALRR